jgi:hypothetical protein
VHDSVCGIRTLTLSDLMQGTILEIGMGQAIQRINTVSKDIGQILMCLGLKLPPHYLSILIGVEFQSPHHVWRRRCKVVSYLPADQA